MLNPADNFFLTLPDPEQSCLLFIRQFILDQNTGISEKWHYNTPFYHYKGKWMCYLSYRPKDRVIYIGFVHGYKLKHKLLLSEGRKQIKVFYLNAYNDVDIKSLREVFKLALNFIESLESKKQP